jgi:hypothetical protein
MKDKKLKENLMLNYRKLEIKRKRIMYGRKRKRNLVDKEHKTVASNRQETSSFPFKCFLLLGIFQALRRSPERKREVLSRESSILHSTAYNCMTNAW